MTLKFKPITLCKLSKLLATHALTLACTLTSFISALINNKVNRTYITYLSHLEEYNVTESLGKCAKIHETSRNQTLQVV